MKRSWLGSMIAVLVVLGLAACGPQLRVKNATGSIFSSSGITEIKFDNATFNVAELNILSDGAATFYKTVKEGSTHQLQVIPVPFTNRLLSSSTVNYEMKRGKKYTLVVLGPQNGKIVED